MSNILSVSRVYCYKNKKGELSGDVRFGYHVQYDTPFDYTKSGFLERTYYEDKFVPKRVKRFYELICL